MGKIRAKQKSLLLKPKSAWVPPGQAVTVAGYRIPDGMVYVGQNLKAVAGEGIEPALINPSLPVGRKLSRPIRLAGGWTPYDRLLPDMRASYLQWLANGRVAPDPDADCLSLFFYGIERRLLFDAQRSRVSNAEWLNLIAEVERLLDLNRESFWMYDHAGPFLAFARLLIGDRRTEPYEARLDVVGEDTLWKIGPSLFAAAGRPLSGPWAFGLWENWLEARRGTAERRCPDEFRELFLLRYREAFRDGGLRVKPGPEPLVLKYIPANPGFRTLLFYEAHGIASAHLSGSHLQQLQKIADQVSAELDPFSRQVGRTRDATGLAALALLPPVLVRSREEKTIGPLREWLDTVLAENGFVRVTWGDLLKHWPADTPGRLTLRAFEGFASFIGGLGYGVEPEPRFGGSVPKEGPFLFRLPPGSSARTWEPGPGYEVAAVVLQLAVAVATADGRIHKRQEDHLLRHIEEAAHLGRAERERLQIRLLWLLAEPQRLLGLEKRSRVLSEAQRHAMIRFLLTVAGADGQVSPGELKQLKQVYRLLRLDPATLFSDVHALASGAQEPVTVRPAVPGPGGFAIPAPPPPAGLALDLEKIRHKSRETEQVSALLEEIFAAEEEPARPAAPPPSPAVPAADLVAGLDAAHSALLRQLAAKTTWERLEIERLTAALGLLPDGALEILNEAAFSRCGAPLLEGDELIDLDPEILEELLA